MSGSPRGLMLYVINDLDIKKGREKKKMQSAKKQAAAVGSQAPSGPAPAADASLCGLQPSEI